MTRKRHRFRTVLLFVPALVLPACGDELPFDDSEPQSTPAPAEAELSPPAEAELPTMEYAPGRSGPTFEIDYYMSDKTRPATLTYQEIDGLAIVEGDIILGRSDELQEPRPRESEPVCVGDVCSTTHALSVRFGESYLWPGGMIPYEIDPSFDAAGRARIGAGIDMLAVTNLTVRPRAGERDYIVFVPGAGCSSLIGRQGGAQTVHLNAGCGNTGVAHEILHAVGLWHEHSRSDRDNEINILWDNIRPEWRFAFDMHATDGIDLGPYDTGSIMHYPGNAFGLTDPNTGAILQTIETNPPGGPLTGSQRLTADDIAGLAQLYPMTGSDYHVPIPGLVFGLRHSQNQSNDFISNPTVKFGDVEAQRVLGGDLGAPAGEGFEWWMIPTATPLSDLRIEEIPPGVVIGMWHSQNMDNIAGDFRLVSVSGGDLGAPSGVGFVWYENPSMDDVNWDLVDVLPPYTVVGLKHSANQKEKTFEWSDGLTYDPLVACPDGFDRKSGGDLGAPSGEGFYWCEKR